MVRLVRLCSISKQAKIIKPKISLGCDHIVISPLCLVCQKNVQHQLLVFGTWDRFCGVLWCGSYYRSLQSSLLDEVKLGYTVYRLGSIICPGKHILIIHILWALVCVWYGNMIEIQLRHMALAKQYPEEIPIPQQYWKPILFEFPDVMLEVSKSFKNPLKLEYKNLPPPKKKHSSL